MSDDNNNEKWGKMWSELHDTKQLAHDAWQATIRIEKDLSTLRGEIKADNAARRRFGMSWAVPVSLFLIAQLAVALLWAGEVNSFIRSGPRCTAVDCARMEGDIDKLQDQMVRQHRGDGTHYNFNPPLGKTEP